MTLDYGTDAGRKSRQARRIIKYLGLIGGGALVLLLLFAFVIEPAIWRWNARRKAFALLGAAKSPGALEAVASQGISLPLKEGSWIAIRYRDQHAGSISSFVGGISSLAVAHDSGGN